MYKILLSAVVALALLIPGEGISQTGTISGVVVGGGGLPESNFTLEIENSATGETFETKTEADGAFRFTGLPPGDYVIATDVGQAQPIHLSTSSGGSLRLQIHSTVGGGSPPDVTTEVNSISENPEHIAADFQKDIVDEAVQADWIDSQGTLNGAYNLSLLAEGIRPPLATDPFVGPGVGGRPADANSFSIEGVDNNNRVTPGPLLYLPDAATQEFTLRQSSFSPPDAHATGGHFNSIAIGGTNQWHGDAYWYLQNRELNARDPRLDAFDLDDNPRFDQNRLGGRLSMPLVEDKLFGMVNLEYIPFGFSRYAPGRTLAPTAAGFQMLGNNPRISASNLRLLQTNIGTVTPVGQTTTISGATIPLGLVNTAVDGHRNTWAGSAGLDFAASPHHRASARWVQNEIETSSAGGALPAFNLPSDTQALLGSIGYTFTNGGILVNDLRLGYNRLDSSYNPGTFAFEGEDEGTLPFLAIQGTDINLGPRYPFRDARFNTFNVFDNASVRLGGHEIQIGGDARRIISSQSGFPQFNGTYVYSSLERYLLDQSPDVFARRAFGDSALNANQWIVDGWVQDRMKLMPDLMLEAGLHYQWAQLPSFARNQSLNSALDVEDLTFGEPSADTWGFGPRVGVAYEPFSKFVVRAGGGVEYDTLYLANRMSRLLGPQSDLLTSANSLSTTGGFLSRGGIERPNDARARLGSYFLDQDLPYTIHWNGGVEGSPMTNLTASVRYIGNRSVHQSRFTTFNPNGFVTADRNLPVFFDAPSASEIDDLTLTLNDLQNVENTGLRAAGFTNPLFGLEPSGTSWYHAVVAEINRRMTAGLQLSARYTLSDLQIDSYGTPLDLGFPRATDHFNAGFNPDHRLTLSGVYDLDQLAHTGFWAEVVANFSVMGTYTYMSDISLPLVSSLDTSLSGSGASSSVFTNPNGTAGIGSGVTPLRNSAGRIVAYQATNPNARFVRGGAGSFSTGQSFYDLDNLYNFDVAAAKKFTIAERVTLELRAEAYNVLNNRQITGVGVHGFLPASAGLLFTPSQLVPGEQSFGNFGALYGSNPRSLQFGLRATF
jgi:hypothetical protein